MAKKLKKIPYDLIPYIRIQTEEIKDSTDKYMIASYCLSKLQTVEWYIQLLQQGSKNYIVPHTLPELEGIRTELKLCYDDIMKVKIKDPKERPYLDIKYPDGYDG